MKLKRDTEFGKESTCRFKFGIRNLTNFDLSTQPEHPKDFHFNGLLLREVYIVLAKKVQRSNLS